MDWNRQPFPGARHNDLQSPSANGSASEVLGAAYPTDLPRVAHAIETLESGNIEPPVAHVLTLAFRPLAFPFRSPITGGTALNPSGLGWDLGRPGAS